MSYDGHREVLHDIDFTLGRGEFLSIVGPSGCGKSTILRLISGLDQATSGRVEIPSRAERAPISGSCFSATRCCRGPTSPPTLPSDWNVREFPKEQHAGRIKALLELLGLSEFGHYYPRALSGGMRQRASPSAGCSPTTREIMLMDEPFGALDAQTKILMGYELLRIWTDHRKSVVFVTHDIEAIGLSDRILVMTRPARPDQIGISRRAASPARSSRRPEKCRHSIN